MTRQRRASFAAVVSSLRCLFECQENSRAVTWSSDYSRVHSNWAMPCSDRKISSHAGSLDSLPPDMIPLTTNMASRADCRLTISSLLQSLRVIYGLGHAPAMGASGGVVVLSREGERWRRLLKESDLVRLWNAEHAT
jgi:hypothetical protein